MQRFHLHPEKCLGDVLKLEDSEAHHALHVVRLRRGEFVTVLDGVGGIYECEAIAFTRREVELHVRRSLKAEPRSYQLTLAQALPKGKLMDSIVQKATELGTGRILPILTERTVAQPTPERVGSKLKHWQEVAIEAMKQCGTPWLPCIEPPLPFAAILDRGDAYDLELIASLQSDAVHPRHPIEDFVNTHGSVPRSVRLWVGPEGDFTTAELDAARASGARPISLGPTVLRTETASIYCLSIARYELSWRTALH